MEKRLKRLFYKIIRLFTLLNNKYFYVQFQMNDRSKSVYVKSNRAKFDGHDSVRRDMFTLIINDLNGIAGDFVECGVYKGHTAKLIHHLDPDRRFYLMDTFNGFGKEDEDMEGVFGDTSVERVFEYIKPSGNVVIIEGHIPESIPRYFNEKKFALVHLDMDLYKPTIEALRFFYDKISHGGCVIVHDYNNHIWPGIKKAVDEFFDCSQIVPMPDLGGSVIIKKQ